MAEQTMGYLIVNGGIAVMPARRSATGPQFPPGTTSCGALRICR